MKHKNLTGFGFLFAHFLWAFYLEICEVTGTI